ncbi:DUF418 domain-containing protein [Sphingobacterium sp. UT-1RO-CII-1]|uniref:DUF418 domain-containing protein n=1 Tax=Sphingobacterium sp. UT-1RO-CII-1 TaxID=2995225 RepID=UPI00227BF799|nr:DUF418 domain-containing protein [Sphingobacterium sp. UT-1RO-CII-1]MCY4778570.1 DUF418 domain-containing protein [Sphingobacterium sp. UT-1RO-CII-1]
MEQNTTLSTPLNRITLLDALRGFSLLGVILMHMLQQFSIFSFSPDMRRPLFPEFDATIQWIGENIIMGRFINIFAFLFGLSFFIQLDRAAKKGIDFRQRFIWRMVVMLAIGLVGNMFYGGEIISLYAVFGGILVLLYRVKSGVLIIVVTLLLIGTPRIIQVSYTNYIKTEQVDNSSQKVTTQTQAAQRATEVTKPSFINAVKHNFTQGLAGKLNYQFGLFGRGYLTFALFLVGLIVGRSGFFERQQSTGKLLAFFISFVAIVLLINYIASLFPNFSYRSLARGETINIWTGLSLMTLNDIKIVAFSGAIVMGFTLLYQHHAFSKYLDIFSPYGRMGLTNYEMQSVIGCLIFSMWAFGPFFQTWGTTELFFLGIFIYIAQLLFSAFWLNKYLYGPLEWFLRTATYLKMQPFKRKKLD